jgi:predicted AAA+ superfamily ATPase
MPEQTLDEQVSEVKAAMNSSAKKVSVRRSARSGSNIAEAIDDSENDIEDFDSEEDKTPNDASASLKFGDDIKLLLIPATPLRVICYFLGATSVNDVKNAPFSSIPMIAFLHQERLTKFMRSKGYSFAGEIAFDNNGNPVPVSKHAWSMGGKEVSFTNGGYLFFDAGTGRQKDNVVMNLFTSMSDVKAGINCYAENSRKAKRLLTELETFTKQDNCVRGAKLRDVNMATATFYEVKVTGKYTWDNYYFPKSIRDMFDLEVFGFVKNTQKYNDKGITKRGIMMFGPPGTGKTTIGHIICNYAPETTVIWITPDLIAENNAGKHAIKLLYTLADYVSPCVIVLEDLDLFSEDRDAGAGNLPLGSLMNILDGVNSVRNAVTVATTNRIELIEKALSNRPGRFDRKIEVPTMEEHLRRKMFLDRLVGFDLEPGVIDFIVKSTDGWTGAEAQEMVNSLNLHFINIGQEDNRKVTREVVDFVLKILNRYCVQAKRRKGMGFNDD